MRTHKFNTINRTSAMNIRAEENERHKDMGATEMAKKNKTIAKQNIFYGE